MTFRRPIILTVAASAAALVVAGCGGSNSSNTGGSHTTGMSGVTHGSGDTGMSGMSGSGQPAMGHGSAGAPAAAKVGTINGLKSSADGYSLSQQTTSLGNGGGTVAFRIVGKDGKPVTKFGIDQTKLMHLIVASRDLVDYEHVHPAMASDGTWSIKLPVKTSTEYRAFADFVAGGKRHVLGWTLNVGTQKLNRMLPPQAARASVDGFNVAIKAPTLMPGKEGQVTFTVTRSGTAVRDLQPYLGALGHLVMLRQGDLEYLHVHPITAADAGGPTISFMVDLPRSGTYRAFLQFRQGGKVHTAAYTVATS